MAIRIKSKNLVKPSEPTWNGILPLSELDQSGFINYTPVLYFYKKPTQNYTSKNKFIEDLKDSLSRTLVPFYPLAGRLHWVGDGGRLELECNAMGVGFMEAEIQKQISDFGDLSTCDQVMFQGLVHEVDYNKPIHELPVALVQLTWFQCGGYSIGVTMSHVVADGQAGAHFVSEWANLNRGDPLQMQPYVDRRILDITGNDQPHRGEVPYLSFPKLLGRTNDLEERQKVTLSKTLKLTKHQINSLKKVANSKMIEGRPYSTFDVIASHIWRSACKARGLSNEQMTGLCFLADSRSRLNPPLPSSYFGDAIVYGIESRPTWELLLMPLSHVCKVVREQKEKMNDGYVRSTIKHLKAQKDLFKYQERSALGSEGIFFGNPNLMITSWLNFPVCALDFGWGAEIYMGFGAQQSDGDFIIGHDNDGSVLIYVGLQAEHMEKFKKYFYEDIHTVQDRRTSKKASTSAGYLLSRL